MTIEFVDAEPPGAQAQRPSDDPSHASPAPVQRSRQGRLLAVVWGVAAVVLGVATRGTLYQLRQTSYIIDFDHTDTEVFRADYDVFGHITSTQASFPGGGGDTSYGPAWLVIAALLLATAAWAVSRPRSRGPAVMAVALGGLTLGSLGTVWLRLHSSSGVQGNIGVQLVPQAGFWIAVAGGVLAFVVGLAAAPGFSSVRAVALARRTVTGHR